MKLFREPLSEEEQIAKLRKSVQRFHRYGYLISAFYLCLLLLTICLFSSAIRIILDMRAPLNRLGIPDPDGWIWMGIVTGTLIGITFGKIINDLAWGFMMPFGALKTEKLLLKYYDRVHSSEEDDLVERSGKSRESLQWWFAEVEGKVESRFSSDDILVV